MHGGYVYLDVQNHLLIVYICLELVISRALSNFCMLLTIERYTEIPSALVTITHSLPEAHTAKRYINP